MSNIAIPVILCGGSGTRLWPLSRAGMPKQFLVLSGTNSLFQDAVARLNSLTDHDIEINETLVVTNEEHRFLASDQLRELENVTAKLLLEPVGKNTAPALTMAALYAQSKGSDPILVVAPADQKINDLDTFSQVLKNAIRVASDGEIVILGVTPDRPETGYGYIRKTGEAGQFGDYSVSGFSEKPDAVTAKRYLEEGNYLWNCGIFVLKTSAWLQALKKFRPDILEGVSAAFENKKIDANFIRPDKNIFLEIPSESIDYAVAEKCTGAGIPIRVLPLGTGWSDLGAWDAVWKMSSRDDNGNALIGDVLLNETRNSFVYSTSRLVATVGVENLVVVETPDAVLVAEKNSSQRVKDIVQSLGELARNEHVLHRKVHRPWGWYDSIDEESRFKVKRIQVRPGEQLSLQLHYHRAEHWIVVKGTAEITCGEKKFLLTENQSTYIPLGEVHRLANPGKTPLEIIEVQSGSYLGEDDIVRLTDIYGR